MVDDDEVSAQRADEMEWLLRFCARHLLGDADPARLADLLAAEGPKLFRGLFDGGTTAEHAGFFRSFAHEVASVMPLPSNGFQPQRLPPPADDAPPLDPGMLAVLVLLEMPRGQWPALPALGAPPQAVAAAAATLRDSGDERLALQLLEPWAKLPAPWPDDRAQLLDLLCDTYLELGKPRKRKSLAQAMTAHGSPAVQSAGWRRLSMMASDAGDTAAARDAFERAQRLTPDEPDVALLELTTLLAAGDEARMRERAAFHARRFARLPDAARFEEEIALFQRMAAGEVPAMPGEPGDHGFDPLAALQRLHRFVAALPPPVLRLDFGRATPADLGELRPAKAEARHLDAWRRAFPLEAPTMAWSRLGADALEVFATDDWMALLERQPRLADQFEVLDGLVLVLDVLGVGPAATLRDQLLARAQALWSALLERWPAARCEWGWLDNRPALRLLVRLVARDQTPEAAHSLRWLQALVEVLNPHDNHGLREQLAAVYLRRGEAARALALCERYPQDFVGLQLLHVRALLALQRLDDAARLLAPALRANPHVLPLLRSSRAPRPLEAPSITVGSPEEARATVRRQHDLWRDKAVQQWLVRQVEGAGTPSLFGDAGP